MRQSARGPHTVEFTQWPVARFCFGYVRPAHRCEVTDGFSFSIVSVLMIDASQTTGGSERYQSLRTLGSMCDLFFLFPGRVAQR